MPTYVPSITFIAEVVTQDELPCDDAAFDAYMVAEGFQQIRNVAVMEKFLIRAARRYHVLRAQWLAALEEDVDDGIPDALRDAYSFCCEQFEMESSDLRMFFSEVDGFYELPAEERRRLFAVADALQCSAKDASKIDQAERLKLNHQQS